MYGIGEISDLMNLSISTIRYYDKNGLIPYIKRNSSGIRRFDEKDIEALVVVDCLKKSGMQIKDIKAFMELCTLGNETLVERLNFFYNQERAILEQIENLNQALNMIRFKQWYYQTAIKDKTEEKVKNMKLEDMPEEVQKLYKKMW